MYRARAELAEYVKSALNPNYKDKLQMFAVEVHVLTGVLAHFFGFLFIYFFHRYTKHSTYNMYNIIPKCNTYIFNVT